MTERNPGALYTRLHMADPRERLTESERLFRAGRIAEAGAIVIDLLRQDPDWPEALNGLAMYHLASGRSSLALEAATRAVDLRPGSSDLWLTRGFSQLYLGRAQEGISDLRRAVQLAPSDVRARLGLAKALTLQHELIEAMDLCRAIWASHRGREVVPIYCNIMSELVDMDLCWPMLAQGAETTPDDSDVLSALSCAANASSTATSQQIFQFHAAYGKAVEKRRPDSGLSFANTREPDRSLRIGIVSSDFEGHNSVSFFMRALFEFIDQQRYPIYAYSVGASEDATATRFRGLASHWRHLPQPDYDALAARIRADAIDIVLELIGHTGRRSLPAFQPRCAPVQVSYLGYSNTTGLRSFDWRIVDSITDPAPAAEALAVERLWRLDPCFVCFTPDDATPPVAALPASSNGFITFGSMSDIMKLNEATLARWGRVLGAVPRSRLLLKNRAPLIRDRERHLRDRIEHSGMPVDRVELRPTTRTYAEHLSTYNAVDIALDTYPYNGTTTVCESLVMGVPILGANPGPDHDRHAARVTLSLLTAAGLTELIASGEDDLIEKAARLASDTKSLAEMRSGLRQKFLASPVCNARAFAQRFEFALRTIWNEYCSRT
jgi:predicted O-linked N-acetylglucosamine transferase (SPINDLY family)